MDSYHRPTLPLAMAPRPFKDELLLSWICRLAAANHVSIDLFFPGIKAMNRYRLSYDPGERVLEGLAAMARLPLSSLSRLLLPNQFPNLSLLSFMQLPEPTLMSGHDDPYESYPLPFCIECAGEGELPQRSLYWQAEIGLLTTILCPRHGGFLGHDCPRCNRNQLTLSWDMERPIVRCTRCSWRPATRTKAACSGRD